MKGPELVLLSLGALILLGRSSMVGLTRGLRNRNPGNLKAGRAWPGVTGKDEKGFAVFRTMTDGINAMMNNAASYPKRFNVVSLRDFGLTWSPPSDNAGDSDYGARLASIIGVPADRPFPFTDPTHLYLLGRAIIRNENGVSALALVDAGDIRRAAESIVALGYTLPPRLA